VVWCGVVVSGAVVGLGVVSTTNRVHEPPAKPLSLRAPLRSKATNSWRSSSDDVTFTRLGSFFFQLCSHVHEAITKQDDVRSVNRWKHVNIMSRRLISTTYVCLWLPFF